MNIILLIKCFCLFQSSKSQYINNNTTKLGFPLTNIGIISKFDSIDYYVIRNYVIDNSI